MKEFTLEDMTKPELIKIMKPDKPDKPCHNCGGTEWWWREAYGPGEWLCGRCHPRGDK